MEVKAPIKPPASIKLERNGDVFTLSVAPKGEGFRPVGSVTVALSGKVYAGLVVCSHDAATTETAAFSDVRFSSEPEGVGKTRVRESTLETVAIDSGAADGRLPRQGAFRGAQLVSGRTDFPVQSRREDLHASRRRWNADASRNGAADRCNNDHGLSPDGRWLAISHTDPALRQSVISVLSSQGGTPKRVTLLGPSYWHGWSPDGQTLAYCAQRNSEFDIYTIAEAGGEEKGSRPPMAWMTALTTRPTASTSTSTRSEPAR